MSVQKLFEQFYGKILLTKEQRKDAKTKYEGVCKKLHEYYYPGITYSGNTKLLIGSFGKHTHIRPARDIDVIFIMPPEKFDQYNDNKSNCQSQLLQDVKKILEEKYPNTPIKAFGKVVLLEFSESKHNIELLPAWENDDGTYKIPNSKNEGCWEVWNPRKKIKKIKEQDSKTGTTKKLIRMTKKWAEKCSVKIESYQIENSAINYLDIFPVDDDSKLFCDYFSYLRDNEIDESIKSHLKTAAKRANKACCFEEDEKRYEASLEWRKIFGGNFPIYKESNKQEKKPRQIVNPPKLWASI